MRYVKRKLTYRSEIQVEERDELYKKNAQYQVQERLSFRKTLGRSQKLNLRVNIKAEEIANNYFVAGCIQM